MNYDEIFGVGNKPTQEQLKIQEKYLEGKDIAIEAKAGSSKTSSLIFLANSDVKKDILYLAFNKLIIAEATKRMSDNVDVRTFHSLAYRTVGNLYRDKLNRPCGGYVNVGGTVSEIAYLLNIKDIKACNAFKIASLVKSTLFKYANSADKSISESHIPTSMIKDIERKDKIGELDKGLLIRTVLRNANKLWKKRVDLSDRTLITHDDYLKLYQLSNPKITGYDVLFVDECQDLTDCVADIILSQKNIQTVFVGDSLQAIYGWKGCINAFKDQRLESFSKLNLTQSFRFGNRIAEEVKKIYQGDLDIKGFGDDSVIDIVDTESKYTKIYRTNSKLLLDGVDLLEQGYRVKFEVDINDFLKKLIGVKDLRKGNKPKHEDLVIYETYQELLEDAEHDNELSKIVNLIDKRKDYEIIKALKDYKVPKDYDITLVTTHKAKGLEFDNVILADDYPSLFDDNGNLKEISQEHNILYVAATRAKKVLQTNDVFTELNEYLADQRDLNRIVVLGDSVAEQAGYELESVVEMENLRDLFANHDMDDEEAFDLGFIDSTGTTTEYTDYNTDRILPFTEEGLDNELELESLKLEKDQTWCMNLGWNSSGDDTLPPDGRFKDY